MCRPPAVVERNRTTLRRDEEDATLAADAAKAAFPGRSKAAVVETDAAAVSTPAATLAAATAVREPSPTRNLPKGVGQRFWAWTSQTRPTWREDRTEAVVAFTVFSITGSTRYHTHDTAADLSARARPVARARFRFRDDM